MIKYLVPHQIVIKKEGRALKQFRDMEMVRLCYARDLSGNKFLTQQKIGQAFGISRQMTNRRSRLVETTDFEPLVKGEYEKSVLTDQVMKRIAELVAENWQARDEEIAEKIRKEKLVTKISVGTVRLGLSKIDGCYIRSLMRQRIEKGEMKGHFSEAYLIDRLLEQVERLVKRVGKGEDQEVYLQLQQFRNNAEAQKEKKGKYRRDVKLTRKLLERDRGRKKLLLRKFIDGVWNLFKEREVHCPDCCSPHVQLRNQRGRVYLNRGQKKEQCQAKQYVCLNQDCKTKYFTWLPNGLESWARANFWLKQKSFELVFHVRGSFRRGADYLNKINDGQLSWTTILNWVIKAGQEAIPLEELFPIRWSGYLCVDEKWVKRFGDWVYIYIAVDAKTGDTLLQQVYEKTGKHSATAFLLRIKELGYLPRVVITDLTVDYDQAVEHLFPRAKHQKCVFHAEKDARKLVVKYFPDGACDKLQKELKEELRQIFKADSKADLEKRLEQFRKKQSQYPKEILPVFEMLKRFEFHLFQRLQDKLIPQTNNAVENLIKEFDIKYQNTFGYSSLPALQAFLNAYTLYLRFKPYASGRFKGLSPLQVAGFDIGNLSWDVYLLAA